MVISAVITICFLLLVYLTLCPLCVVHGQPAEFCEEIGTAFAQNVASTVFVPKHLDKIAKQSKKACHGDCVDLVVCGEETGHCLEGVETFRSMSGLWAIITPFLLVLFICFAQSMVSIFGVYYHVGGQLFMVWHYIPSMAIGFADYVVWFWNVLVAPELYFVDISVSFDFEMVWKVLFNFTVDYTMDLTTFKFAVLWMRTVLHLMLKFSVWLRKQL